MSHLQYSLTGRKKTSYCVSLSLVSLPLSLSPSPPPPPLSPTPLPSLSIPPLLRAPPQYLQTLSFPPPHLLSPPPPPPASSTPQPLCVCDAFWPCAFDLRQRPGLDRRVQINKSEQCRPDRTWFFRSDTSLHTLRASLSGTFLQTPGIAFRHLPPSSAGSGCATEGALFISTQLSIDAVGAIPWTYIYLYT